MTNAIGRFTHRAGQFVSWLLLLALPLVFIARACADSITYDIVPVTYPDLNNGSLTDTLSGTITISSTGNFFGTYNASSSNSLVSFASTLTTSNSNQTISLSGGTTIGAMINNGAIQGAGLVISSSGITVPYAGYLGFENDLDLPPPNNSYDEYVHSTWYPQGDNGDMYYYSSLNSYYGASIFAEDKDGDSTFGSGDWLIATPAPAPEPGSFTMLLTFLVLGFGATSANWHRFRSG